MNKWFVLSECIEQYKVWYLREITTNAIANNGVMLQPRLIDSYVAADGTEEKVAPAEPRQIVSESTAQQVQDILESAVTEGQIKDAGFCGYTASIVGMAPMDDPRFIVEVVLQRPKGSIYGITNGPVFRSVMSQALRTYNVQPSTGEPARLPQFAK